jgi:hypothetical protein
MAANSDDLTGRHLEAQQHAQAHEAGLAGTHAYFDPTLPDELEPPPPGPGAQLVELHVCMGLNACKAQPAKPGPDPQVYPKGTRHDPEGKAPMAGMGSCATALHACHGDNACRGQGGCGYAGSAYEQSKPGEQSCNWNGSCASPINRSRVFSDGPFKGQSVWKRARALFEARMYEAGIPFGPSPSDGYPDDVVPPGFVL